MTAIVDTFNRTDSTTSLGTTSDGTATWTAAVGTWGISTNRGYQAAGAVQGKAVIDTGASDGTLEVTVIYSVNFIGPVFRWVDSNNYWYLQCKSGAANSQLRRVVAGSGANVLTNLTVPNNAVVDVVLSGNSIIIKANGTQIGSTTDSNMATATNHGIGSDQTNGGFLDDWSFTPPAPVPITASDSATVTEATLVQSIIVDNFNRANSVLDGTSTSDGLATWAKLTTGNFASGSVLGVVSNQLNYNQSFSGSRFGAVVGTPASDGSVSLTVVTAPVGTGELGLVGRWESATQHCYRAHFSNGFFVITEDKGFSNQLTSVSGTLTAGDVLTFTMSGSALSLQKNGTTVASGTASITINSSNHGVLIRDSGSAAATADDFKYAQTIVPGPTAVTASDGGSVSAAYVIALAASESASLTSTTTIVIAKSDSQSSTLTSTASIAAAVAGADSSTLTGVGFLTEQLSGSDAAVVTESGASGASNHLAAADSATLSESASTGVVPITSSDSSVSFSEQAAIQPTFTTATATRRWAFADPDGVVATYEFPINPNKMGDPWTKKSTTSLGISPISARSRASRNNRLAPRDWTFSGVTRTQAEQDAFLAWFELDHKVWLRDHFGRLWEVRLINFNPEPRRSTRTNNYRFSYAFTARVYRRIA